MRWDLSTAKLFYLISSMLGGSLLTLAIALAKMTRIYRWEYDNWATLLILRCEF